ncbi:penicillin-binding protein 1A [Hippea sp. KM1]|uniref:penicillin-binding protein 1A n=1 Tax=Hippea sp. KM1 TaxID=944481 RepID=UPI00046D3882|nr:PBP1A family penicillin-binding protein [Hippea sp. KM1]
MRGFFKAVFKLFLGLISAVILIGLVAGFVYFGSVYMSVKKDFNKAISVKMLPLPTKVYSADGKLIAKFGLQNRIPVKLKDVSPWMRYAILAAEDARFYEHGAIDLVGIARALIVDVVKGKIVQGGSTITQQLVKNVYLTPARTIDRKVKEIILAYRIEKEMSKDEILQLYLNTVYFGDGAWGVEAAARTYFDKHAKDLTISESAMLAGLVAAPSYYNPYKHPKRARKRTIYVLRRMYENHFINLSQYKRAMNAKIVLRKPSANLFGLIVAPYFTDYIRSWLIDKYGEEIVYKSGLNVYTTLDTNLQRFAFIAVKSGILSIKKRYDGLQAALIAMDPKTGYIKALIGGFDYSKSQFNRALQARRQPGSSFKPIIYLTALTEGYLPDDTIADMPIVFRFNGKEWRPQNYERVFHGTVTLKYALAHSVNVATINLLNSVGIGNVISMAHQLGIREKIPHNLSIALGSLSVKPIEMVRAYAAFDNYGLLPEPIFITKIVDKYGRVIYRAKPRLRRVFDDVDGYILTGMLRNVILYGTGRAARVIKRPLAGKTGTTNNYRDAWFIGYSPDLVCGVWVGYDDNRMIFKGATGARAALPIWIKFMSNALEGEPVKDFPIPKGITKDIVDMVNSPPENPEELQTTKPTIQQLYENAIQ